LLKGVFARRERLRSLPPEALQVKQVPKENRLAFQQIETVAAKASAIGSAAGCRGIDEGGAGLDP